jgi:Domain of unknown function (DUF222)
MSSATFIDDRQLVLPSIDGLGALSDDDLLQRQRDFGYARRRVDAGAARVAAEIERRSRRELGQSGLAQRQGSPTATRLLEVVAGVSPGDAHNMVAVGSLLDAADDPATAWLGGVAGAVESGDLSLAAAQAIREGLGVPSATVDEAALQGAAARLVSVASDIPVRRLAADARALRDSLDVDGIAEREEALRERRYLRLTPQNDGMTRVNGLLDPESAAIVVAAFDQVTAPRRGGPRFVDPTAIERAQRIVDDPRTTDQLVADAFVDMVRIAGAADTGTLFAQKRPAVQIHVAATDLASGRGTANFEGQTVAASITTAQRIACGSGAIPILFGADGPLDVGRAHRTFTARQRIALAARDGGCRWRGCDRPPSWTEAHHVDEWDRDQGPTDVANGILLCRFHHLHVHNLGWRIVRRGREFVAVPPLGSGRAEILLPTRSPVRA